RAFASDSSSSPLRAPQASASSPPALFPILPRASTFQIAEPHRTAGTAGTPPPRDRSSIGMAYVDHAFSITDDDDLVGGEVGGPRGAPVKEIAFAAALLAFGVLGVVAGSFMAAHQVGGDSAHGIFFAVLGVVMFIPGFYYTRIAYYAYKGYKGFSFSNIPPI
ncbi:unnamed protein product, partial [Urochloa humidicola]